ncbi:hypothetical protein J5N97_016838 [Dioscorea zingiberensis]|uniref:Cytochrome P450 n=1 Tax=Dioscorea zingiberensis TaxID=325984 RepID=A0A9D5CM25_9LILI|nr:hypothetical protein J5N97_016838 [Dioscorea zingiberensis]
MDLPLLSFPTTTLLLLLLLLLFPFFIFIISTRSTSRTRNLPPGPKKLPIIGNLHQLGPLPHRSLHRLAATHGPLMHLQLGQIPTLIISSPQLASQFLKTHDLSFCTRPSTPTLMRFSYNEQDITSAKYGEHWRQLRKLCTLELFNMKRVHSFRAVREDEVHLLIQTIRHCCSQDEAVNLSEMFLCLSNNITCREVLGKRFSEDGKCGRSENHELVLEMIVLTSGFSIGDLFPGLEWLSVITGTKKRIEWCFRRMDELFEREIEEHCLKKYASAGDDHEDDFLDVMLKLQKDSSLGFLLTRDHIKGVLMNMFLGGTDSSETILIWGMSELIKNPRVMEKVQNEIRHVVGNKGKVEESDLKNLSYLKYVINETLRMHPPAPLLVPRECREECKINGYDIPLKTRAFINVWALGRDPKSWEDPEEFRPERFEGSPINYKGQHFEFIPFGAGRRICPGIQLGAATLEITFANVLYHFNWKLPCGECGENIDMSETFGVGVHKKLPLVLMGTPWDIHF